ncbi:tail fiber assembly protein [Pseudomonas sp. CCC3.2]|uniref:tail fiber assembly protein n=1 Tax=unclassified Pseudomonas TaxID=196821 RepID=UPI002AB33BCC|nr:MULTISPECIES: tail fiber assembly protein [unclassified Pseudomonas]MDY7559979.1 tail fiber assembly protein [Pseudomonas sp. AB6]MEB0179381.1 tail fiber assembly protein [Pseudomonas sp. CCC3.2]MEB0210447.1 tail fiber assembly protein [Pseudomonas sp. AB6]
MTLMYVQFTDATETKLTSIFGGPQDPDAYPNQGVIEDTDQRYLDFFNPPIDVAAVNTVRQSELVAAASLVMAPILVSLQLGDATDEETLSAKAWQAYYRALKSVDVTVKSPAWPELPA